MQKDKISIIVTCFNKAKYIEECLESIFKQTYRNIEILIYDDGSTDNSKEMILKTIKNSPFEDTYFFSESNKGANFVRNEGLSQARGDYLIFIDGDDFIDKDYVEILYNESLTMEADIVFCRIWDFNSKSYVKYLPDDYEFELKDMFLKNNVINVSALINCKIIDEVKFDLELNNELFDDLDFWLNLIITNKAKAFFTTKTKLNYRVLENSISHNSKVFKRYYRTFYNFCYITDKYINEKKLARYYKLNEFIMVVKATIKELLGMVKR